MEAEHLAVQINKSRINNISYNSGNVITTLSRHVENPGIIRTVYLSISSHIQDSAIFSHV